MFITRAEVDAARRSLFVRPRAVSRIDWPDFKIRPISEEWRFGGRLPAYKSAVANAAYIWRDSAVQDRFGPMPTRFAERRYELRGSGLALPASAPVWAGAEPYRVWAEADTAAVATGDPTAVSAWHVMMEIPQPIPATAWVQLVEGFLDTHLVNRGAVVAWAIHAVEGEDGWIVSPHAHMIVTARYWRHDRRHGWRHPNWIASWAQQKRLEMAWRRHCSAMRGLVHWGFVKTIVAGTSSLQLPTSKPI